MQNGLLFLILLMVSTSHYAQNNAPHDSYTFSSLRVLDPGVYDSKKIPPSPSYKILTGEEAQQAFHDLMVEDYKLCRYLISQETDDETVTSCSREYIDASMEYEVIEYSPDLQYANIWHGAGAGFILDIKNRTELCSNPSTYIESPTKKYRLGIHAKYDDPLYYLEIKEGNKYRCQDESVLGPTLFGQATDVEVEDNIRINALNVKGIYWEDDETIHFLVKRIDDQTQEYIWVGYAAKIQIQLQE